MCSIEKIRCQWPKEDPLMIKYHDEEWGVPVHDDQKLFEYIVLDAFQAGLSWKTILHKRVGFKNAFAGFDYKKVAKYTDIEIDKLLNNENIVRNKAKILATISNAKMFLLIQKEFGSFNNYIWSFTKGKTIHNKWKTISQIPASTSESDAMSFDLKKRGFKFVGSTICYAFMQAAGMINDHTIDCFRYHELKNN